MSVGVLASLLCSWLNCLGVLAAHQEAAQAISATVGGVPPPENRAVLASMLADLVVFSRMRHVLCDSEAQEVLVGRLCEVVLEIGRHFIEVRRLGFCSVESKIAHLYVLLAHRCEC